MTCNEKYAASERMSIKLSRTSTALMCVISFIMREYRIAVSYATANITLHIRRNLLNISISPQRVDQRAQSKEIITTKPGSSVRRLGKQVRYRNIGPRRQYRVQAPFGVVIHHSILSPVQSSRRQDKARSALRMKGVGDLKSRDYGCTNILITDSC